MRAITKLFSGLFGNSNLTLDAVVEIDPPLAQPREVTLGSLINARERAIKEADDAQKQAERDAYEKRIASESIEVVRFLEAVKVSFTHDIKQGRKPHSVMVPEGNPFNTEKWHFDKMLHYVDSDWKHPHRKEFEAFFKWVKSQRLYVGLIRREDGRYFVLNWAAAPEDKA